MARFVDQAKIYVKAGDGGAGCISFRRENMFLKVAQMEEMEEMEEMLF